MRVFKLGSTDFEIPSLGCGTWQINGQVCYRSVLTALETGYRYIDTADRYGNHRMVAKAIKDSGVKREEIFLASKLFYDQLKPEDIFPNTKRFLEELGTDYLDLLLIHWPNKNIPIKETLEAMDELRRKSQIKSIGVSNFTINHLKDAIETGIQIVNNQVELHPSFNQNELKEFCDASKITVTAYSPLGMGEELKNPQIVELSEKYRVSPAQIILNWIISRGIVAIPKSTNPDNIRDNFNSLNWEMESQDIERINNIEQKPRLLAPPFNEFNY